MSAQSDELLRAILERPDDDALRLVYADWLEEHGDPDYACFIRAQIELGRVPDYHPLRVRLWHEQRDLVTGLPFQSRLEGRFEFRRGFPWQVGVYDLGQFVTLAPQLFAQHPIQALSLHASYEAPPPAVAPLADSPWLARLRRLQVHLARWSAAAIDQLGHSRHAGNLSNLDFSFAGIDQVGLRALLSGPLVRRLESLTLTVNDFGIGTLGQAIEAAGGRLRSLEYSPSNHGMFAPSLRGLFAAPLLRGLVELSLDDEDLGPERLEELAASPLRLESLSLGRAKPGVPGVRALAGCAGLAGLRQLVLTRNQIGPVAAKALAESPYLRNLWVLKLADNPIGDRAALALAESSHLTNLVELDLDHCEIGDRGAEALMRSPVTQNLIHLGVYSLTLGGRRNKNSISEAMKRQLRSHFGNRVSV